MKKISRFIISEHFHPERFANETGRVISFNEDQYHIDEVEFDNPEIQKEYLESDIKFEAIDLLPSNQKGKRELEFESKLIESLTSLFERGVLDISTSLEGDYDGKLLATRVSINKKVVYTKEERVYVM